MTAYAIKLEDIPRDPVKSTFVRLGPAAHYLLTEPHDGHTRITISSSTVLITPECYAFATCDWSISGLSELSMSQKGTLDHGLVLVDAGYILLTPPVSTLEALKAKDYDLLAVLGDECEEQGSEMLAEALRLVGQGQLL